MKTAFYHLIQDEYLQLQDNAEAALDLFTLAESAEDDLLKELIPLEEYLIARLTRAETDIIIEEYLNRAIQNLYHRITFANSSDTIFTELKKSGAAIVEYDHLFLPPDDGQLQTATSDTPNEYTIKTEPRLLMAITALKSLGIYGDDLIIRIGKVDNDMMRKHPYIVLEIPRINKQIILCEQIGNRTFVSHEILDPKHFEILKKSLLRSLDCVTDFVGGKDWSKSLLDHLSDDSDTFKDSKKIPKLSFKEATRRPKPIQLSEAIIKQAAIDWANEHDGKFPTQLSGGITSGILKGENWYSIRQALRAGSRGLSKDKYTGLADFLEIHGLKVSRFSQSRNLMEDMILEAAKEWADEHDGKYPAESSDKITSGILKGETWKNISGCLRLGSRGLPKDTYTGLADFLEIHGLKVSLFSQSKNLTEDIILKAVKEWAIEHDGKYPTRDFGEITSGILKGENWINISMALRAGLRGLPKDTYTGLVDFLEIHGLKVSLFSQSKNLTEDMILEAVKEWANEHDGKFPNINSGENTSGILKGDSWINISMALRNGSRGLPKDTYTGLADFLEIHGLKVSLFSQSKNLTEDIILKAVKEWAIEHDGKYPTRDFGEITSGILKGENWINISMALRAGLRGLPKDTYTGLPNFLEIHGMKISLFSQSKNLTEDMILDAMKEWANDHDGKFPTQQSSGITSGILKGETWKNISGCLRLGLRGLPKDTYKGLGDFKTQHNLVDFTEEYEPLRAIGNFIRSLGTPTP